MVLQKNEAIGCPLKRPACSVGERAQESNLPGFTGAGVTAVPEMLRLDLNWFCGGPELPGQLGAIIHAGSAIATGLARRLRTPVLSREPPCPSLACTGHGEGCRMGL